MKTTAIIPLDEPGLPTLPRLLASLSGVFDEALLAWRSHGSAPMVNGADLAIELFPLGPFDEAETIRRAVKKWLEQPNRGPDDWAFVVKPGEFLPPPKHTAFAGVLGILGFAAQAPERALIKPTLEIINAQDPKIQFAFQSILWVEDANGMICRDHSRSVRGIRARFDGKPIGWDEKTGLNVVGGASLGEPEGAPAAYITNLPVLHQPLSAFFYESGNYKAAMELSSPTVPGRLDRRIFFKARDVIERNDAFDHLAALFKYMSLHEELWRLGELMKVLPYSLEEYGPTEELRKLYKAQTEHLEGGEPNWYANGSPGEVIDEAYVLNAHVSPTPRVNWLVAEAEKRGLKRVVELGSVDGPNIFTLMQIKPEIEWVGVEVNPKAVHHGHLIAEKLGMGDKLNLVHSLGGFQTFAAANAGKFDGAALFEILEHNSPGECAALIAYARMCVRKGGRVFISTPDGNWSAFDETTRILELRKDHINAWTEARMGAFLRSLGCQDIEIRRVENPHYWEANGWVFASFEV